MFVSRRFNSALAALAVLSLAACVSAPKPPSRTAQTPRPPVARPVPPPPTRYYDDPSRDRPHPSLVAEIRELWRTFPGTTGIAIQRIDGTWSFGERKDQLFPQQSVSKLWVVLTILDMVDRGEVTLGERVRITPDDLAVFHQPIRDRVLNQGEVNETVLDLIEQAITASDNTANDSLLRRAGGPDAVRRFIANRQLGAIRFGPGERLLQSGIAGLDWRQDLSVGRKFYSAREQLPYSVRKAALDRYLADPVDGASPAAIAGALSELARGNLLSPSSTQLLLDIMTRTRSGPNRLKAGVPAGWQFLHKTGTGQDLPPVSTGYNDVGIMTAPDGTRYAVVVMLGDTTAGIPARMRLMQSVSRAVARYHGL